MFNMALKDNGTNTFDMDLGGSGSSNIKSVSSISLANIKTTVGIAISNVKKVGGITKSILLFVSWLYNKDNGKIYKFHKI